MTLVLTGINDRFAVVTADCMTSINRVPFDRELIKTAVVWYADARLGLGFTGIASQGLPAEHRAALVPSGAFRMMEWLLKSVIDTSRPDRLVVPSLERLTEHMTTTFPRTRLGASHLLVVGFAGYRYTGAGVTPMFADVSNFDPAATNRVSDRFTLSIKWGAPAAAALGLRGTIEPADMQKLGELIQSNRPAVAVSGKSIDIIRKVARTAAGLGVVGDICTSVTIPADRNQPILGDFQTVVASDRFFQSHVADASGGPDTGFYMDLTARGDQPDGTRGSRPVVFPRVPDAAPCTCGSGRKYRHCHKRRKASRRRRARSEAIIVGRIRLPIR